MKLVQLEAPRRVGLPVPRTLVTNSLVEARRFLTSCRRGAVVKSLSSFNEGGLTRRTGPRTRRWWPGWRRVRPSSRSAW
jgi:hypothetical protein